MKKMLLATVVILAPIAVHAQSYSNLSEIIDASQHNEARFDRDYKGKVFDGYLKFRSADKQWMGDAQVNFYDGGSFAYCYYHSQSILAKTIDWRRGQSVHVHGTIDTTVMGDLTLHNCTLF